MKIRIKKQFESEAEIEIEFPAYFRTKNEHFKVPNENISVEVYQYDSINHEGIRSVDTKDVLKLADLEEITEAMYNEAYEKTIDKLNSL